jgi:hypothetical protein
MTSAAWSISFAVRKRPAAIGRVLLDHAEDAGRLDFGAPVVQVVVAVVPEIALGRDRAQLGDAGLQRPGVFERQVLAAQLPFRPRPARPEARLVLLEQHERGPEALKAVDHVVVETGHDRDHRDDGRDTDDDPEDRQGRPQLVRLDGQQREADVLSEAAAQAAEQTCHGS